MAVIDSNIAFLKALPFFSSLLEKNLSAVLGQATVHEYPKKKVLFVHGDPAQNFYVILNGWVKLFRETMDGDEAVISLLTRGDTFGEAIMFADSTYPSSCQIVESAKLIEIPGNVIRQLIKGDGEMALKMLASMSHYMSQMEMHIEHLTVMSAPQRVGCFLLKMCVNQTIGTITLQLPYDKSLIASRLGMKPETFSRSLKQLQDVGVTITGDSAKIQDIEQLADYCCIKCSGDSASCEFASKANQEGCHTPSKSGSCNTSCMAHKRQ